MKKQVVIIGGGASGMVAGIEAARRGAQVMILEHTSKIGKKLLSTGNGKCNLTNMELPKNAYRSENPDFALQVLKQITVKKTLDFFQNLGLQFINKNGYIYPSSGQASSVLELLCSEVKHLNISVIFDCNVKSVEKRDSDFVIHTSTGDYTAHRVILSAGSKAASHTGSDGSGYELALQLGHGIIKPLPALVQLRCKEKFYQRLAGIRTEAKVTLFANQKAMISDRGELQFTDYGISGIPVFQVSRYGARALDQKKKVMVVIDLFPGLGEVELNELLVSYRNQFGYRMADHFLIGILNQKLASVLLDLCGINRKKTIDSISNHEIKCLVTQIKHFETMVTEVNPFANAQACSGGVDTLAIDATTMESKLVKNLYFAGEILDVDGICGGYNLQWAWSSGILAGKTAGERPL